MANVIVGSENVKGNITTCEQKEIIVKVDRKGLFSLRENTTHQVYDVCTKKEISQYTTPGFTAFGIVFIGLVIFISCASLWAWAESKTY